MPKVTLSMSEPADELLSRDPLALLLGMLLDQQVPMEKAFAAPYLLRSRLGHDLDARELADMEPERLRQLFADKPALHRFPGSMADRVQQACQHLVQHYGGDPVALWATAESGAQLLERMAAVPGFGPQKAAIFVALLGKQYGVRPAGWREAAGGYGEEGARRSVADVTGAESLAQVRDHKRAAKQAAKA